MWRMPVSKARFMAVWNKAESAQGVAAHLRVSIPEVLVATRLLRGDGFNLRPRPRVPLRVFLAAWEVSRSTLEVARTLGRALGKVRAWEHQLLHEGHPLKPMPEEGDRIVLTRFCQVPTESPTLSPQDALVMHRFITHLDGHLDGVAGPVLEGVPGQVFEIEDYVPGKDHDWFVLPGGGGIVLPAACWEVATRRGWGRIVIDFLRGVLRR